MAVVTQNETLNRFEVHEDGSVAFLEYRLRPGEIVMVHTEVPAELEGRGIGGQLAKKGLDYARAYALRVIPNCPFVASYIKRHPEYLDLVPEAHHARVAAS
ncbi:MAG: GNAT family N-acetyltransferase [Bryobacteraceae bacterium]